MSAEHLIIIQARMGSSRLPGKMLMNLGGKPVINHVVESMQRVAGAPPIVVATSNEPLDDDLAAHVETLGVEVYRGANDNVASRFRAICELKRVGSFVRVNGDSPLIDYRIVDQALNLYRLSGCNFVSTAFHNSFPSGSNVEVLSSQIFLKMYKLFTKPEHFEHVTRYFYEFPDSVKSKKLSPLLTDAGAYKLSLDTVEDFSLLKMVFASLEKPPFEYTLAEKCMIYVAQLAKIRSSNEVQ